MRPSILHLLPFFFLFSLLATISHQTMAQVTQDRLDSALQVEVTLKDGNQFVGIIIDETDLQYTFQTKNYGQLVLMKENIRSLRFLDDPDKAPTTMFYNLQSTNYFFLSNGYGLRKGEAYYRNVWIFLNEASYGITDNVSIGAGLVPLFLFAGAPSPFWIKPHFSIPNRGDKTINLGLGGIFGSVLGELGSNFALAYGQATIGNRDKNLTLGIGYGQADGTWGSSPAITLSGFIRTGERGFIMTENYFIPIEGELETLLMLGGRRLIGNFGLDYGFLVPLSGTIDASFFIPWLGFSVPLNIKE